MIPLIRRALLVLPALCLSAHAETFIGAKTSLSRIEVNETRFSPWQVGLLGGARLANGLGGELHLQTGVTDDDSRNSTMSVDFQGTAYATANAISPDKTTIATFGGGYTLLKTDTQAGATGFPGSQSFDGAALMLRFEERFVSGSPLSLVGGYEHFFFDSDLSAYLFSLGVNYAF